MAQNFKVPLGLYAATSDPSTPTVATGDIYYNSSANELRVYNGTAWQAVGGGGAVDANTLTGTTLASNVVNSSLTSFGSSPTITTPILTLSATTSNTIGRIAWDNTNSQIEIGNGSALKIFTADDATATLTNKTISGASNTVSTTGTLTIGSGLSGGSFNGSSNVTISLTNNSVTVNGTAISLGGSGTITAATPNTLTIGTGLSGTSFNGSSAVTIAINSDVVTLTDTQTLTNKTITQPTLRLLNATSTGFASGNIIYNGNLEAIQYSQGNSARTVVDLSLTQTLSNKTLSSATLTGTLTAGGGVGTSGQVLQSTGTGVQWATAGGGSAATRTTLGTVYGLTNASTGTTPLRSTYLGYEAGNASLIENAVYIGYEAARAYTGSGVLASPVVIGYRAAVRMSGQDGAVVIGDRASVRQANMQMCTVVGGYAMGGTANIDYAGPNPGQQTAIGYKAMGNGNQGGANVAVGDFALNGNSVINNNTGLCNVSVGSGSGQFMTSGSWNAIVGCSAGGSLTSGNNNTVIGGNAGNQGISLTSGSNNILLGYIAAPTSSSVSNTITLGNSSITTLRCQQTSITSLSDQRDKTNIVEMPVGLEFINALRPVVFEWNVRKVYDEEGNEIPNANNGTKNGGFIAQELDEVQTRYGVEEWLQLVLKDNPDKLEASPGKLLPIMIKAIQELSAKIERLEQQLGG